MAFLAPLAAIAAVGGSVLSGIGAIKEGQSQKAAGNYNAKIYEQNAEQTRASQQLLETQKNRATKSQIGTQTALYGKSGLRMTGSPINVITDSLLNSHMDINIDKYNSEVQARGYQNSANMARYEGKQAATASYFKAGSSFLSAGASLAKTKIGQ